MNRSRLLTIGAIALALGAFVSFMAYRSLMSGQRTDNRPGVDVVVAAHDLEVGAKIGEGDVRLVRFPAETVPQHAFLRTMSTVIGRGVVLPISQGEFILADKLAGENAGSGLPSLIPPQMRAVSVRVNEVVSVAGFVKPGTHVDVLLTGNPTNGAEQQTTTVLQNVAVIAAGGKTSDTGNDPQNTSVITLLVSPDDAQKLTLASAQGRIQLSLRNPLDTRQTDLPAANQNGLYKGIPVPPVVAPKVHAMRAAPKPPAAPPGYTVDVIQGTKRETTKVE